MLLLFILVYLERILPKFERVAFVDGDKVLCIKSCCDPNQSSKSCSKLKAGHLLTIFLRYKVKSRI